MFIYCYIYTLEFKANVVICAFTELRKSFSGWNRFNIFAVNKKTVKMELSKSARKQISAISCRENLFHDDKKHVYKNQTIISRES